MASKPRRYTGELATPIVLPAPPTFWGAVTDKRVKEFWRDHERHLLKTKQNLEQKLTRKMCPTRLSIFSS